MSNLPSHSGPSNQQENADFAEVLRDLQTTQADVVPMDFEFNRAMEELDAVMPEIGVGGIDMDGPIMDLPAESPIVQAMMDLGMPPDDVDSMLIADLTKPFHDAPFQQSGEPTIQDRLEENQSLVQQAMTRYAEQCQQAEMKRAELEKLQQQYKQLRAEDQAQQEALSAGIAQSRDRAESSQKEKDQGEKDLDEAMRRLNAPQGNNRIPKTRFRSTTMPQSLSTPQLPRLGSTSGVTKRQRKNTGSRLGLGTGKVLKHAWISDRNESVSPMLTPLQSETTPDLWSEIEAKMSQAPTPPIRPPSNHQRVRGGFAIDVPKIPERLEDAENPIPEFARGTFESAPDTGFDRRASDLPRQYKWIPVPFPGEFHPAPIEHEKPSGYPIPHSIIYRAPVIRQSNSHNSKFPSGRVSAVSHAAYLPIAHVVRGASISDDAQGGILNSRKILACDECRIYHKRCTHKTAVSASKKPPHQVCEECRTLKQRCLHRIDVEPLLPLTASSLGSGISVADSDGTPTTAPLETPQTPQTPTLQTPRGTRNHDVRRCSACAQRRKRCTHLNPVSAECAAMSDDLLKQHATYIRTQIRELEATREELGRIIKENKKGEDSDYGDSARRRRNLRIRINGLAFKYQTACAELEKRGLERSK